MTDQAQATEEREPDEAGGETPPASSLVDDLSALIEDGQTYVTAEIAYQKTRLSYATTQGKAGIGLLVAALALLHLALIALVVGLVFALSPLLTPFGATAAVTLGLLLLAGLVAAGGAKRMRAVASAFDKGKP